MSDGWKSKWKENSSIYMRSLLSYKHTHKQTEAADANILNILLMTLFFFCFLLTARHAALCYHFIAENDAFSIHCCLQSVMKKDLQQLFPRKN